MTLLRMLQSRKDLLKVKHKLKIILNDTQVEFPETRQISHAGKLEGTSCTMADGTETFDVTGFRSEVTYRYDYVPQKVFDTLIPLLRVHRYFDAVVLDVDNVEKQAKYSLAYPTAKAFKLTNDGGAVWHNVTIKLTAKEVSVL